MPLQPLTLFEILQVTPDASPEEIQDRYEQWIVRDTRAEQPIPAEVQTAYENLIDSACRNSYVTLLEARRRNSPLRCRIENLKRFNEECKRVFLTPWECPHGMLGVDGQPASLNEVLLVIRLEGEAPLWPKPPEPAPPPPPPQRPSLVLPTMLLLIGAGVAWYMYERHQESPQHLEAEIRKADAAMSDYLDGISKDEGDFQAEVAKVIGPLPPDGSLPDDLARVCFREKTAAQAWESIKSRTTVPSALVTFQTSQKTIERRIHLRTFVDADRKALNEQIALLATKRASFGELRRDLDLLRVLLEAERLPSSATSAQKKGSI